MPKSLVFMCLFSNQIISRRTMRQKVVPNGPRLQTRPTTGLARGYGNENQPGEVAADPGPCSPRGTARRELDRGPVSRLPTGSSAGPRLVRGPLEAGPQPGGAREPQLYPSSRPGSLGEGRPLSPEQHGAWEEVGLQAALLLYAEMGQH